MLTIISASFKFKQKITSKTAAGNGRTDVDIIAPLNIYVINCVINLILTWFDKGVSSNETKVR